MYEEGLSLVQDLATSAQTHIHTTTAMDDLEQLLNERKQRDLKHAEMRERVAREMAVRLDTGVRVNHALAKALNVDLSSSKQPTAVSATSTSSASGKKRKEPPAQCVHTPRSVAWDVLTDVLDHLCSLDDNDELSANELTPDEGMLLIQKLQQATRVVLKLSSTRKGSSSQGAPSIAL